MLKNFILVGIGGASGAVLRYAVTLLTSMIHAHATLGTMAVNILGSFMMGAIITNCQPGKWTLLLAMGLCGGFTTFSTFSAQSMALFQEGKYLAGICYVIGTAAACILFCYLGTLLKLKAE